MKQSLLIVLFATLSPCLVQSARINRSNKEPQLEPDEEKRNCCCKRDFCGPIVKTHSTSDPVFSPNDGLCCKFKEHTCGAWWAGRTKYTIQAPDKGFCKAPVIERFEGDNDADADASQPLQPAKELLEGTPEHTVQSYCEFTSEVDVEDEGSEADQPQTQNKAKDSIVKALVSELEKNSLDAMAKEIFSIYACVRWAPTPGFVAAAEGEMKTEQLDQKSAYEHFDDMTFMPLRCSKNFNVYGHNVALGDTHFEQFEKDMVAQAAWYTAENKAVVQKRLADLQDMVHGEEMMEAAKAFDILLVRKTVAQCHKDSASSDVKDGRTDSIISVDPKTVSTAKLLADCAAARWWLEKLEDWHQAMPFSSFMSPDAAVVSKTKPASNEQVLVCFGKRVASQLHRRAQGDHLLTDQSMVGCHGFWTFEESAKMLDRIVQLWRPPTCQLASMALDMKMKMMDLIATMNTQLFDALPAMLDEEASTLIDDDGESLKRAGTPGAMMGVMKSIGNLFGGMSKKYVRLGQMLGNTVVKWIVCPLKPITDNGKMEKLDMALGTEDDLARHYAQAAYAKWTGKKNLLPGEECTPYEPVDPAPKLPRPLMQCSLGEMQENMPEKYRDPKTKVFSEFLCPVRPFLPAKQQLKILQQKAESCPLYMDVDQMKTVNWMYNGRRPHKKQYEVMANAPQDHYQYVKILDMNSHYDDKYYVTRTFVTIGRGCTEDEAKQTPRFCKAPEVANEPSVVRNLLTGVAVAGSSVVGGAGALLVAAGVKEATPVNTAYKHRIMSWMATSAKSTESWIRSSTDEVFGRTSTRWHKLRARLYKEVEANELLHSLSFQSKFAATGGDSKNYQRFDRFAVTSPCEGFDPNREFRLKFKWSEQATSIARKAFQKNKLLGKAKPDTGGVPDGGGVFRVQVQSAGVLRMDGAQSAWMNYYALFRSGNNVGDFNEWIQTSNPFIKDLVGIFDSSSDRSVKPEDLLGFEATFSCGTRKQMHDDPYGDYQQDFSSCVKKGAEANKELRKAFPNNHFTPDEVVIRVSFKSLSACHKDMASSTSEEEKVNPVYANFAKMPGCEGAPAKLPSLVIAAQKESAYRGLILGKGLPEETLLEVLIDPENFLQEVTLK